MHLYPIRYSWLLLSGKLRDLIKVEVCRIKKIILNVIFFTRKVLILRTRLEAKFGILQRVGTVG